VEVAAMIVAYFILLAIFWLVGKWEDKWTANKKGAH
jgi:hypothetical protein